MVTKWLGIVQDGTNSKNMNTGLLAILSSYLITKSAFFAQRGLSCRPAAAGRPSPSQSDLFDQWSSGAEQDGLTPDAGGGPQAEHAAHVTLLLGRPVDGQHGVHQRRQQQRRRVHREAVRHLLYHQLPGRGGGRSDGSEVRSAVTGAGGGTFSTTSCRGGVGGGGGQTGPV